ncbi:hypothetical protein [Antarcticimicrobium sediminis]|uniref:hypothetical protein n=1 Tax=Antarcticimicrobium sediminis TaxID=2546227 RepID=UPI0019D170AF|nr:hypothetical protein [Antarcticimicrobium sediminis]
MGVEIYASGQARPAGNRWRATGTATRLAAACHNPVLKTVTKRMRKHGKPHKVVIIAIARRLITIANAMLKTGETWRHQAG